MRGYRKDDVEYHRVGYGDRAVPAVNVKVDFPFHRERERLVRTVAEHHGYDPDIIAAWWEENEDRIGEDPDLFGFACELGWEDLQREAEDIFGSGTKVYSEGRSGGWACIDGIDAEDVESWDAIDLNRWARFARIARAIADDVPYQMVALVLLNEYEPEVAGLLL